jgi:hypothetical protein
MMLGRPAIDAIEQVVVGSLWGGLAISHRDYSPPSAWSLTQLARLTLLCVRRFVHP